jgi:hypothetical protein
MNRASVRLGLIPPPAHSTNLASARPIHLRWSALARGAGPLVICSASCPPTPSRAAPWGCQWDPMTRPVFSAGAVQNGPRASRAPLTDPSHNQTRSWDKTPWHLRLLLPFYQAWAPCPLTLTCSPRWLVAATMVERSDERERFAVRRCRVAAPGWWSGAWPELHAGRQGGCSALALRI